MTPPLTCPVDFAELHATLKGLLAVQEKHHKLLRLTILALIVLAGAGQALKFLPGAG